MSAIVLLDTSIFLNVLDVEGWNQNREEVLTEFKIRIENGDYFLLPMATIWETGNHIAKLPNGGLRRKYADILVNQVSKAIIGDLPYHPTFFPSKDIFIEWLSQFSQYAQRNKSMTKLREGVSLADFSMIMEWEITKKKHSMSQVLIWSLDSDLACYDTGSFSP